ncbi:hypothetical protein JRO89_XS11G0013500 [Xanthoceras sorbifolium]|uniref:Uncharacterized protein n=1 Tax=Xanthoceras sorbifolium TaxID=99658 RepID=A0ABQ8HE94_9ROSI|nr:hypothetical protein JRO89_XS11G0013500 [Xanthoceras sorbifolium]
MKPRKRKPSTLIISATSSRSGGGSNSKKNNKGGEHRGRLVDENMIVLRMRIQETLRNEEEEATPPSNWMEWEKSYYAHNGYNEDVFEGIGFLQNCLMNMRPGLALGFTALVALSLVMSAGIVFLLLSNSTLSGETKRKFESVYRGGTMSTPDSGQVFQYWHCCGSEDPFDPGCTAAPHASYND